MRYDIFVFRKPELDSGKAVFSFFESVKMGTDERTAVEPQIDAFFQALDERWPELDGSRSEEGSPWTSGFDRGPNYGFLRMDWSKLGEIVPKVFELSREHGVGLVDCQLSVIYFPDDHVTVNENFLVRSPALYGEMPASAALLKDLIPALKSLNGDRVVILRQMDSNAFMQSKWTEDGFVLEFSNGKRGHQARADKLVDEAGVITTLTDYAAGGDAWKGMHSYNRLRESWMSWLKGKIKG